MAATTPVLFTEQSDGSIIERDLPTRWEICSCCDGHGKSSAYLGAYTQSDIDEVGPDFMEDYMAGRYDRACDACGGSGKIKAPDYSRMSKADRAELRLQQEADAQIAADEAHERRQLGAA